MSHKKDNLNKYSVNESHSRQIGSYKQGINESKGFSKRQIEFMFKRLEKLSSAIYIVTDLVSDNEPLKWKLRQISLSLLSDTSGYKLNISENVYKMISFLDIALAGNIVSEMNGSVLKYEFEGLIKVVENIKKEDVIGKLFLYEKNENSVLEEGKPKESYKGHLDTNVLYKTKTNANKTILKRQQRKFPSNTKGHKGSSFAEFVEFTGTGDGIKSKNNKQTRRITILDTVRKKNYINVKDISVLISGCSEKTLQRELISMVKDKILKKHGEKRWSKYSLLNK